MRPLDGITVVTLEQAVAAPFATRQLADLGARVIKIERPEVGDFARSYDETVNGLSSHFVWLNRSKESITLDLKHPETAAIMERLIAGADVFVQNLAPGAAARMGLGADRLLEKYPALIVCDISGYGRSGPYSDKKAYDLLIQSEAGLLSITGSAGEHAKAGISVADISAGMYAYSAILTALLDRGRTGKGTSIEVSMLDSLGEWMGYPLYYGHYGGTAPKRTGASHATIYPYGPFRAGDGRSVILGVQNEREWRDFCTVVLKMPELSCDERFNSNTRRVENSGELGRIIDGIFGAMTAEEVVGSLELARVANARINGIEEVWSHPQFEARDRWREVETEAGPVRALLPPATFAGFEARMDPIPRLGSHTEAILAEAGFSSDEIGRLRREGAI